MEHIFIPIATAIIGVAVGYGAIRNQVKTNSKVLSKLVGGPGEDPAYVRRGECDERSENIQVNIDHLKRKIDDQAKATKRLENFARWMLSKKEELDIVEVSKILNGD